MRGEGVLRWLNEGGRQTALRFMLWRWRAALEDRTALKQRVRQLERELAAASPSSPTGEKP